MTLAPPHSANESRPRGLGYGVRFGSDWFRLATTTDVALEIVTREQLAERSADGVNAYENLLKAGFAFVRGNFTGGEGLDRYPRVPPGELDDTRYWASRNVDLRPHSPGRPFDITLSNRFDLWYTAPGPITDVRATTDKLYLAYEDTIVNFTDDGDPSVDALFTFPTDVVGFDVSDADEAVALLANGAIYHKPAGTDTWTVVTDPELVDIRAVWMVKSRILAWRHDPAEADASELIEVGLGITGTPDVPSYTVTVRVVDTFAAEVVAVEDVGLCVLAITTDRYLRSYVPRSDSVNEPPVLTLQSLSPMPIGEQPVAVAHNSGKLLILATHGSVTRAYSAAILDEKFGFIVSDLAQLRVWEGIETFSSPMVRQVVAARDEFLWAVATIGGDTDLWRYDVVSTGIHNHSTIGSGLWDGVAGWADRGYVFTRGGTGLSRTSVYHQASGWLITPLVNFNLNTDINWVALTLQAFDLLGGGGVQVEVAISSSDEALLDPDHVSWRIVARLSSPTIDMLEVPLAGETHPKLAMRLTLRSHPGGAGSPRVTQVGVRGIPAAQEIVCSIPVSISDQLEVPGRMPVRIPGFGDMVFDALMELRGKALDTTLVSPPLRIRGMVTAVGTPIDYLTHRGSNGRYSLVEVLGDILGVTEAESGLGGGEIGIGLVGTSLVGIGEN